MLLGDGEQTVAGNGEASRDSLGSHSGVASVAGSALQEVGALSSGIEFSVGALDLAPRTSFIRARRNTSCIYAYHFWKKRYILVSVDFKSVVPLLIEIAT